MIIETFYKQSYPILQQNSSYGIITKHIATFAVASIKTVNKCLILRHQNVKRVYNCLLWK